MLKFTVSYVDSSTLARAGTLELFNGVVQTPVFMPVGTNGAVKTLLPQEVRGLGAEIILGNTYHLYLRPGHQAIADFGGIRKWNKWDGPVLTDSGGFQVFSLGGKYRLGAAANLHDAATDSATDAGNVKITEEGVTFSSHFDGSKHLFTPENVVDIQLKIGSDILMVLDECTEYPATYERAKSSMERTHRWAKRAADHFAELKMNNPDLALRHNLFGIAQGSTFEDLRRGSLEYIASLQLDGIAVGGVSVGEGKEYMYKVMDWTGPFLPKDKPHYLMGIGEPEDLIRAVAHGYDMFDCVLPTRLGRYGIVWRSYRSEQGDYLAFEKQDMKAARFRENQSVINESCGCPTCTAGFSTGFIGDMLRAQEVVGMRLTSVHNLWTLLNLMAEIRSSIQAGTFAVQFERFLDSNLAPVKV